MCLRLPAVLHVTFIKDQKPVSVGARPSSRSRSLCYKVYALHTPHTHHTPHLRGCTTPYHTPLTACRLTMLRHTLLLTFFLYRLVSIVYTTVDATWYVGSLKKICDRRPRREEN